MATKRNGNTVAYQNPKTPPGPVRNKMATVSISSPKQAEAVTPCALRPDAGGRNAATTIRLFSNHFVVKFEPAQQIFHYVLRITESGGGGGRGQQTKTKALISKADALEIKKKLMAENRAAFGSAVPVYDGGSNLYSTSALREGQFAVKLSRGEDWEVKEYTVVLKLAARLDGRRLAEFLNTGNKSQVSAPQKLLQALNLVVREHPSSTRVVVGRSVYSKQPERDGNLGGGIFVSRGFSQSLRPTAQGLALNVDFSVKAFHKPVGVLAYLLEKCRVECKELQPLSQRDINDAEKALKGLEIRVTHKISGERFTVWGLTKQITRDLKFEITDENKRKRTVGIVDYFKQRYGRDVRFKFLPCLDLSRSPERTNYVPMEFCEICEGQKYSGGDLSDSQSKSRRRMARPPVKERLQIINDLMARADGPRGGTFAPQFKITVGATMTQVTGRVLEAPLLKLGDGGPVRQVAPRPGDRLWNLRSSHVFDGRRIDKWGIISFSYDDASTVQRKFVQNFGQFLVGRSRELGIRMSDNPSVCVFDHMKKFSNVSELQRTLLDIHRKNNWQLQILICVMAERNVGYKKLKLVCETEIGLVTQCCLYEHVKRCGEDQKYRSYYLLGLALKINAKVGGSSAALLNRLSHQLPRFGDSQVLYIGAHVSHPASGDGKSPSIAAVAASINWPWCNRYVSKIRSQANRQEHIQDLGEMSKELLDEYMKVNHQLPRKILFFRNGIGEDAFGKVLNKELAALREAFKRFKDYKPTISFIVAQKSHHTRLFPANGEPPTKSGNVPPGTVVDTVVVHPRQFDFYLCSHYGQVGTSKPKHYYVLWDENSFTSDELQTLINNLCYTFSRCTKPVSLPPPLCYAGLAAYRGRQYVEGLSSSLISSAAAPSKIPKLHVAIENLMFFC